MLRVAAFSAAVASAAAFMPLAPGPACRTGATATNMAKYPGQAPNGAPPADLFNIWRNDYMLTPQQAAAEASERKKNTLFDGVLPPFSNVGETTFGEVGSPTLSGLGVARDFSTANPTSAYDVSNFGKTIAVNPDVLINPKTGAGPDRAFFEKKGGNAPSQPRKRLFGK